MYKNIQIYNYICNPAEELIPVRWSGVFKCYLKTKVNLVWSSNYIRIINF